MPQMHDARRQDVLLQERDHESAMLEDVSVLWTGVRHTKALPPFLRQNLSFRQVRRKALPVHMQ